MKWSGGRLVSGRLFCVRAQIRRGLNLETDWGTNGKHAAACGVLHWLNENFECIFMVSGLLMIIFSSPGKLCIVISLPSLSSAPAPLSERKNFRATFLSGYRIWLFLSLSGSVHQSGWIFYMIICPKRWQNISWIIVRSLVLLPYCGNCLVRLGADRTAPDFSSIHNSAENSIPHSLFYLAIRFWPDIACA